MVIIWHKFSYFIVLFIRALSDGDAGKGRMTRLVINILQREQGLESHPGHDIAKNRCAALAL